MKGINLYNSSPIKLTMVIHHRHSIHSVYINWMTVRPPSCEGHVFKKYTKKLQKRLQELANGPVAQT